MQENISDGPDSAVSAIGPAAMQRASGIVKWYDRVKGYGFIVPDDGGPDIFLGKAVIDIAGFGEPEEGCKVVATLQVRNKGRSATGLVSLAPPDPEYADAMKAGRRSKPPAQDLTDISGPKTGIVKLFNPQRGFGFITIGDGTADIFFHVTTPGTNLRMLSDGDHVDVTWGCGPNGLIATEVTPRSVDGQMLRSA